VKSRVPENDHATQLYLIYNVAVCFSTVCFYSASLEDKEWVVLSESKQLGQQLTL